MPELPEVETVRRGLKPFILNKKIVQCLPEAGEGFIGVAKDVEGATVTEIRRFGKALVVDLDNELSLMIHLRMTGQLIWRGEKGAFAAGHPSENFTAELPNRQTRVIFVFSDGKLFFNDQRKFGFVKILPTTEVELDKFIAQLAKEPWEMQPAELYAKCQKHGKSPIKAVLLDQKNIAGLGNIYADEACFDAKVHPAIKAGDLTETEVAALLKGACKVMQAAIDSGGSTMATYVRPDGTTGDYLEKFAQVFRREGQKCHRCGTIIEKTRCAGRGTHFCPGCQPSADNVSLSRGTCRSRSSSLRSDSGVSPRKNEQTRSSLGLLPDPLRGSRTSCSLVSSAHPLNKPTSSATEAPDV